MNVRPRVRIVAKLPKPKYLWWHAKVYGYAAAHTIW